MHSRPRELQLSHVMHSSTGDLSAQTVKDRSTPPNWQLPCAALRGAALARHQDNTQRHEQHPYSMRERNLFLQDEWTQQHGKDWIDGA